MSFQKIRAAAVALAVLATLLFSLTGCSTPDALTPRAPTPGIPHFTVMTFNVHREKANDDATVNAIAAPDADIVCLQEITAEWQRKIVERLSKQYRYMMFAPKENAGGLAVLSHFPLEDHGVIPVPGDWHPAWRIVATTSAGRVQVMHVHLRSMFNGNSNFLFNWLDTGKDHVAEIELFMKHAFPDLPTLVVGDFNESPKGKAVKWLQNRGFHNALRLFKPKDYTWRGRSLTKMVKMTIDHVMFDSSFEPLNAWTAERGGSDHYPVVAHLEVPSAARTPTRAIDDMTGEPAAPAVERGARPISPADEPENPDEHEIQPEDDRLPDESDVPVSPPR